MISVCVATYNGGKFLYEQLTSVLYQIGEDDEVIISDDGSNDETLSIIESINDERIKLLHHEDNHGFTSNFENALQNAKGDYIFLSDQDDVWMPDKVEKVIKALENYDLVVHNAELVDGEGKSLNKTYYSTMHNRTGFLANLWRTRWLGCCMAFKRDVLVYCLPFPPKITAHDYWIGMMGMTKFKYHFMAEILISYRRHGNNASPSSEKSNNSLFYKIMTKRYNLVYAIIKRKVSKCISHK